MATTAPPPQSSAASSGAGTSADSSSASMGFGGTPLSDSRFHACAAFLAGDETISVVPTFNYRTTLRLVSRPVGPFQAGVAAPCPLWLACYLRRRNLCRIVPPDWLDVDELRDVLRHERDPNEASFSPRLPFRHSEVARAVLSACGGEGSGGSSEEIPNADQVRLLLEDIQTVRMDKIRRNVHTLSAQSMARDDGASFPVIDVTGIGSLEMHAVRPFVATAFRDHRSLTGRDADAQKQGRGKDANSSSSGGRSASAAAAAAAASAASRRRAAAAAAATNGAPPPPADDDMDDDEDIADEDLQEPVRDPPAASGRSRIRRFR